MAYLNTNVSTPDTPDWLQNLPKFAPPAAPAAPPGNWLTSGVKTGWNEAVGALGGAEQAVGTLTGWQGLSDYGKSVAENRAKLAQQSGRPDLEAHPWSVPGIGYQVAKALPSMAGMIGAGALATAALPEAAAGGALATAGAAVPRILGGGAQFFPRLFGAAAAGYPLMVGGNVEEAKQANGGELTPGAAAGSLALGLPEAAAGGLAPASFHGPVTGGLVKRLLTGAAQGAAVNAPAAAVQQALKQQLGDPNKTTTERAKEIVDAALGGGLVGGAFGGALRVVQRRSPGSLTNTDLDDATAGLKSDPTQTPPDQGPAEPAAPNPSADAMSAAVTRGSAPSPETRDLMGGFGQLSNDELLTRAEGLTDKESRSPDEDMHHALTIDELQRRTPPGSNFGEATLFTPEEMGARVPAAEAFAKAHALPEEITKGNLIVSEPELINTLNQQLNDHAENGKGKPPKYLRDLAEKYDLDGEPIATKVTKQEGIVNDLWEKAKRNPGMAPKAQVAQAELGRLRGLADLHNQADELLKAQEAEPAVSTEAPTTDVPVENGAESPATSPEAVAADDVVGKAPEGITPAVMKHWENMSNLFGLMRDTDPEVAGKALNALDALKAGNTKRGVAIASRLARENADELGTQSAEPAPPVELPGVTSEDAAVSPGSSVADIAPDHPAIKDGSKFEWTTPDVEDVTPPAAQAEGTLPVAGPDGGRVLQDLQPSVPTSPADHIAATQKSFRDTASQMLADPNVSDAQKALLQRALMRADAGSHSALQETMTAIDKAQLARAPEGPFTGAAEKVVGTDSVPQEHVGFVGGLMKALKMGGVRVLIAHPDDVTGAAGDAHGLNGEYRAARLTPAVVASDPDAIAHVRQFGPDGKDFMVYVKPGMSDADTITALGHEVGHVAEKVLFNQAPESTRTAVQKAFEGWLKDTSGLKAQDMVRLLRNKTMADDAAAKLDPNQMVSDLPNGDYYRSFSEWFADNTSKWLTAGMGDAKEKPRSAVDRFFASVAQKWRDVVSAITGDQFAPDATVKKFLNSVVNSRADRMWAGDADGSVKFAKATKSPGAETVQEANDAVQVAVPGRLAVGERMVASVLDSTTNLRRPVRRQVMFAAPGDALVKEASRMGFNSPAKFYDATKQREALDNVVSKASMKEVATYLGLPRKDQMLVHKVANYLAYGIDPRKAFAEQERLHERPNSTGLQALTAQANKDWTWMRQNAPNAVASVQRLLLSNRYAATGEALARLNMAVERETLGHEPVQDYKLDTFQRLTGDLAAQGDVAAAHGMLEGDLKANLGALKAHVGLAADTATQLEALAKATTDPAEAKKYTDQAKSTRRTVDGIKLAMKVAQNELAASYNPYFHLGREGDFMVSGHLAVDDKGLPKNEAIAELQKRLTDAGFGDYALMPDHDNAKVFMRVKTESQLQRLSTLFDQARKDGHLDNIAHGDVSDVKTLHQLTPEALRDLSERLYSADMVAPEGVTDEAMRAAQQQLVHEAMRSYLDSLRGNALPKFLAEREAVQGFSKNWGNTMLQRFGASSRSIATMATSGVKSQAMREMRDEVQNAKYAGESVDPNRALRMQDFANELLTREKQRSWEAPNNPLGFMTRVTHAFSIGASPAYVLTLASQFATLVWPELAKTHGYLGAATAMAKATPRMFTALRASLHDGHFIVDPEKYRAAGLSAKDIDTLVQLDNQGGLTTNSLTQLYTKMAAGEHGNKLNAYANLMGYTSEMMPKILAALAAGDLHDAQPNKARGMTRDQFVYSKVDESNFDYGFGGTPRALGQHGVFGSATPLVLQFQGFHVRLMAKYYREMQDLLGNGQGTPAELQARRAEAGKFLAGHLAAITVLAGTTGLPAAGLFAGVADKVANALTGRDDFDVEASYRSWLAGTFGRDVGEVLAKGLPHYGGVDLSHLGESRIIPLTELVASKRKFEDARADYMERLGGPSLGEASDLVEGGRDIVNGYYMHGLEKILPGELKNLAKAYHMTERGYEDKNGLQLPISPGAKDILMRVFGIQNARKAEYDDERETMLDLLATRTYRAQTIARSAEMAINHGDAGQMQSAMQDAQSYTLEHLGLPSPLTMVGRNVERFTKQGAVARGLGMVLGQKPTDLSLGQKLGFGNWR